MRQEILNWNREKHHSTWEPFLKLLEAAPLTQEEYDCILEKENENGLENLIRHSESHFDPVRKCLNSIHYKDKFIAQDLTEIDREFLSGIWINFTNCLARVEKYPMSKTTLETLIRNPNTTSELNEKTSGNIVNTLRKIVGIANNLHEKERYGDRYFFAEDIQSDLGKKIIASRVDDPEKRKNRLNNAPKNPEKIQILSTGFKRNADVIVEVLLRAQGVCERCNRNAPFIRKSDGTPYLEVHHKIKLSNDGEDTVENTIALCPNCHRELHFAI
jgi:hypothetical protein